MATMSENIQLFCTFRSADHWFGVPVQDVKEVTTQTTCTRIPHAPREVSGYVNIRGHIFMALDSCVLLGIEGRASAASRLILFKPDVGPSFWSPRRRDRRYRRGRCESDRRLRDGWARTDCRGIHRPSGPDHPGMQTAGGTSGDPRTSAVPAADRSIEHGHWLNPDWCSIPRFVGDFPEQPVKSERSAAGGSKGIHDEQPETGNENVAPGGHPGRHDYGRRLGRPLSTGDVRTPPSRTWLTGHLRRSIWSPASLRRVLVGRPAAEEHGHLARRQELDGICQCQQSGRV